MRIDHREDDVVDRRGHHHHRAVHRSAHLRVGAGEIGHDPVAFDRHGDLDMEGIGHHAVVLHPHFGEILSVRKLGDLRAHAPLGVVVQLGGRGGEGFQIVALAQLAHAPFRRFQRADHGVKIAPGVARGAVVGEDDAPDIFHMLAPAHDLGGRKPQPFLIDIGRIGGERPGRLAADLGHMPDVAGKAEEHIVHEERAHHHVLRQVAPAPVAVVVDQHIAGMQRVEAFFIDGPLHRVRDRAHHRRGVVLLGNQIAVAVQEHRAEIEPFVEDRRIRRLQHHQRHLGRDVGERVMDDVQRYRIESRHGHTPC